MWQIEDKNAIFGINLNEWAKKERGSEFQLKFP